MPVSLQVEFLGVATLIPDREKWSFLLTTWKDEESISGGFSIFLQLEMKTGAAFPAGWSVECELR